MEQEVIKAETKYNNIEIEYAEGRCYTFQEKTFIVLGNCLRDDGKLWCAEYLTGKSQWIKPKLLKPSAINLTADEIREIFLKAAKRGDADAMWWLGYEYEFGSLRVRNSKKAFAFYMAAIRCNPSGYIHNLNFVLSNCRTLYIERPIESELKQIETFRNKFQEIRFLKSISRSVKTKDVPLGTWQEAIRIAASVKKTFPPKEKPSPSETLERYFRIKLDPTGSGNPQWYNQFQRNEKYYTMWNYDLQIFRKKIPKKLYLKSPVLTTQLEKLIAKIDTIRENIQKEKYQDNIHEKIHTEKRYPAVIITDPPGDPDFCELVFHWNCPADPTAIKRLWYKLRLILCTNKLLIRESSKKKFTGEYSKYPAFESLINNMVSHKSKHISSKVFFNISNSTDRYLDHLGATVRVVMSEEEEEKYLYHY